MKTVAFHNLGCKVNAYETDIMQQKFLENGFRVVPFSQKADIYVINTCTVTNIADRKSRQMLHKSKANNPDSIVIAVGCYVQTDEEGVRKDAAVDIAIGNNRKADIIEILNEYLATHDSALTESDNDDAYCDIIDINKTSVYEDMTLVETGERTRAYIKIQDGCNQFCSYCLIPYARGRVRSRDMEDIVSEIKGLCDKGYQEFVLTGIHISSYGITTPNDLSGNKLAELIVKVGNIPGVRRLRLGSLEPRVVTENFCKAISGLGNLCPHFHLSLQSGSDNTLKRMNRHYTAEEFKQGVKLLRQYFNDPAITTDVIVGFPGETEEDFTDSYNFCKEIGFFEMHIFKYSNRKGTVADRLPGQISETVKGERSDEMLKLEASLSHDYRERHIGKTYEVLFEDRKKINGVYYQIGHTPEYIKVAAREEASLNNCIKKVTPKMFLDAETLIASVDNS